MTQKKSDAYPLVYLLLTKLHKGYPIVFAVPQELSSSNPNQWNM
jgi:hypothetical protein